MFLALNGWIYYDESHSKRERRTYPKLFLRRENWRNNETYEDPQNTMRTYPPSNNYNFNNSQKPGNNRFFPPSVPSNDSLYENVPASRLNDFPNSISTENANNQNANNQSDSPPNYDACVHPSPEN